MKRTCVCAAVCMCFFSAIALADCPICVPPYCGHSNYTGQSVCALTTESDVASAKSEEHVWLRSTSFPDDMAAYSPTLSWALRHVQNVVTQKKIRSAGCMGKLGGGKATEDGGAMVFEATKQGANWTIRVNRFDKATMDGFRARADKGDIDPSKEYFAPAEAILTIEGAKWSLKLPKVSDTIAASGVIRE